MRVLITGGAGFIGSHLTERMLREGREVAVLDDLSTGWIENLRGAFDYPGFEFVEGSVLDGATVRRLVAQSDLVVHLAAAVGVRYVLEHPLATILTNVDGTHIVLDACGKYGKKALVASTSEVYGKNSIDALCETADSILGASSLSRWSYATSKKLDEFMALAYASTHGLPVIVTRFFNIVGPRQASRYGMVLPNFIRAALKDEPIRVFGDGCQTRNFTYVSDCIDALLGTVAVAAGPRRDREHRQPARNFHSQSGRKGQVYRRLIEPDRKGAVRSGLSRGRLRRYAAPGAVHLQDFAPHRVVADHVPGRHDRSNHWSRAPSAAGPGGHPFTARNGLRGTPLKDPPVADKKLTTEVRQSPRWG